MGSLPDHTVSRIDSSAERHFGSLADRETAFSFELGHEAKNYYI